jgi:hypothetical protein
VVPSHTITNMTTLTLTLESVLDVLAKFLDTEVAIDVATEIVEEMSDKPLSLLSDTVQTMLNIDITEDGYGYWEEIIDEVTKAACTLRSRTLNGA